VRLHHVSILVADLAAVAAFYRDVIGLAEIPCPRDGAVWLDMDGAVLMLEAAPGGAAPRAFHDGRHGHHVLALRIAPGARAGWERRLEAAGVAVVHRTPHTIYVQDPEGNRLGLSHYPEPAPA
jgi:catechol-2,3-dioxygenase